MTQRPSPLERYQADLQRPGFVHDPAQERAVRALQRVHDELMAQSAVRLPGVLGRFRRRRREPVHGLYLWGGVGRGKTYLMDCFHETLPRSDKRRVHFHHFMEEVHDGLARHAEDADPLVLVGQELVERTRVLCFDEFFVSDIADAMILARLLEVLFEGGMTLVATSNIPPDQLYRDGLQRMKFLPAIELVKAHCAVLHVDSDTDYRLRILEQAEIYHYPLGAEADRILRDSFRDLAPGDYEEDTVIHVNHRSLPALAVADGIGWFTFDALCNTARAAPDYIELARRFNTVLVSDVPRMGEGTNDPARRFINLVDELYDRNVNLIISAAAAPDGLYHGDRLAFEFQRTVSRLTEMQSQEYLGREHRA